MNEKKEEGRDRMIKVLMCGNHPTNQGGMTSVINQILDHAWEKEGIHLTFVPTFKPGNPIIKSLFFLFSYIKIVGVFLYDKPDMVHMHMSYKGSFTRKYLIHKLCKKNKIPDIIHLHGSEFKKWYDAVDEKKKNEIRTLLREASVFIVLGEKWEKTIKEIEPATNTVVVSNTVPIPEETVKWNELFKILFLGVLIKRKGVSDLLKATRLLKDDLGSKIFQVVIAGSGQEEENLKNECMELEIEDVVNFVGWTDGEKKTQLLKECQMLVLPSYNEGLPMSILEAMSYGMPILATNVGDISSAVIDGVNGYLVKPGSVSNLLNDMKQLILNRDIWINYSKNSRQLAVEKFSEDVYFNKMETIYRELIKRNHE